MRDSIHGVYTALVTPFREDGVDFAALEQLIEHQIEAGIHGLVPCGTTGESATLTVAEHDVVVKFTVDTVAGRVPVLAGAGSNSTIEAVARTRHAAEVGADATLHIMPYYNKPGQKGMVRHVEAVAEVGVPIVLYNIPSRTGVSLTMESYRHLAQIDEVIATKEATGDLAMAESLLAEGRLRVLSGDDGLTFPLVCLGGHGVVSVTSNVAPAAMVELYERAAAGDVAGARESHFKLLPLMKALFLECNPGPAKAALALQGRCEEILRLPLTSVSPETRQCLESVLSDLSPA
ncbi:MAG: 4-hydroxy-tetrahydrodipicolinate synthase [Planctomycetota bacterium]